MKKLLILTLALCFMASAGFATMTRVLTMGDANGIVKDDANIWIYPSLLYDHPDIVVGEFGYSAWDYGYYNIWNPYVNFDIENYDEYNEFTDFGVHYKFGEDNPFVLGVYFTTNQPNPYFPYSIANFDYYDYIERNDRLDLFYARMLGENKFGFHFAYLQGSYKYDNGDEVTDEYSTSAYEFGFGLTAMQNKLDVAADIAFLSWTNAYYGEDITEPDGNMILDLNGRYWYEVDQKITLVPHANISYYKVAGKDEDEKLEYKYTAFDAGLGLNYTPAAGIMAIGDFGFLYEKYQDTYTYEEDEETDKDNYFTLPYFRIGLDAVVFNWMDLRLGCTSYWVNETNESDPGDWKETEKYVETYTFLGTGFHWGNLTLDTYMDPAILLDGFEFIRGNNQDTDDWDSDEYRRMNYQVSLKYNMF